MVVNRLSAVALAVAYSAAGAAAAVVLTADILVGLVGRSTTR